MESGGLDEPIARHYDEMRERDRLSSGSGLIELARTREVLLRYLPPPPARVADVGGGAGVHALWLASLGYEVHLVDPVAKHIAQALADSEGSKHRLASAQIGDARRLELAHESVDALLLLGPLYHLIEREDRLTALREARRVLRAGGVLFAGGISRFASALDGLFRGYLDDPEFQAIVAQDLESGQHRNPNDHPSYFTTAYFHHPDELAAEVGEAGFGLEAMIGLEGPGWLLSDFEHHWNDPDRRERLMTILRKLECEPALAGLSAHVVAIARK